MTDTLAETWKQNLDAVAAAASPAAAGGGPPAGNSAAAAPAAKSKLLPPVLTNPLVLQGITVVVVFLVSLILLVTIRPGFLYRASKDPEHEGEPPKFNAGGAAWFALGAALLAAVCMVVFGVVARKKRRAILAALGDGAPPANL